MNKEILLVGGGMHCKSCIDVIEQEGSYKIAGIVDLPEKRNSIILGYEVIGTDSDLPILLKKIPNVLITLGQIKSPYRRIELYKTLMQLGAHFPVIISPHAYVSRHAQIGEGTIVLHHALINAGAQIGVNCIIDAKTLVEHDAVIDAHCHISTGAIINGGTKVEEGSFIDSNSAAREYIDIGRHICAKGLSFPRNSESSIKVGVFGASGFSREIADILNYFTDKLVYIDLDSETTHYFGKPVVNETEVSQLKEQGFVFAIGTGDNRTRQKIYNRYPDLSFPNIVHPIASMGHGQFERLKMKKGNIITAGTRFTNNIEWGNFGIFNLNCTVGHDCIIQDFVNVAPGANISGNVLIEQGAYIGTNAAVLQGKRMDKKLIIGSFSIVGSGAVVTKDVPNHTTVVGIPAEQLKRI